MSSGTGTSTGAAVLEHGASRPGATPALAAPGSDGAGPMTSSHWLRVGCIVVLAFMAGIEWHRVFGWGPVVGRVAAAAIVPAAVAVASRHRRPTRAGAGVVVSLVLAAWFLAVVALHDSVGVIVPTLSAPGGIVSGLVNGWAGILSVPLPVPAQGEYLVLPVALTWLATLAGAELVLRARWPLAGVVPPALAYALTLLFGIGSAGSRLVTSSIFLAVALLLAGATARPIVAEASSDRGARRRRAAEVGGCMVGVVLVAALVGPSLPFVRSGHPYNPRTSRIPPETPTSAINPLDELSVWALHPHGPTLLTVHWSGSPQPLQLAVLGQYSTLDGWTESSRFAPAGTQLPSPAAGHAVSTTTVREEVRLGALSGPWLPAASQPVQLTGTRALVNTTTGVLVAAGPTRGLRYEVTSVVPTKDCTLDAAVAPGPGTAPVASMISSLADQYASGATSPCARAADVAAAYEQHYSYNPKAPSGSNIQVLENFLQGPKPEGGGTGTYEQAAAACALMDEALGMKARVVVGFHAGQPLGGDTYQIHPNDAYAWVEVDFVGAGWVSFYPTLRRGPTPKIDQADQGSSQLRHNPDQTTPNGRAPVQRATPSQLHRRPGSSTLAVVGVALGIVLVLLLLVILAAAVTVAAVRRRRSKRRKKATDLRMQVLGAWEESLDTLATVGVRRRAWETAEEVVTTGTTRLGGDAAASLVPLARLSNAARYSDEVPTPADADTAWDCADSLLAVTSGALGRWGRVRRAVDLRSVFRRTDR